MREKAFGHDYEVIGHKIAEMVGNFYEQEIKVKEAEIERLRQQIALLLGALSQMVRHHDQLTPEDIKQAKDAIAKATGGE